MSATFQFSNPQQESEYQQWLRSKPQYAPLVQGSGQLSVPQRWGPAPAFSPSPYAVPDPNAGRVPLWPGQPASAPQQGPQGGWIAGGSPFMNYSRVAGPEDSQLPADNPIVGPGDGALPAANPIFGPGDSPFADAPNYTPKQGQSATPPTTTTLTPNAQRTRRTSQTAAEAGYKEGDPNFVPDFSFTRNGRLKFRWSTYAEGVNWGIMRQMGALMTQQGMNEQQAYQTAVATTLGNINKVGAPDDSFGILPYEAFAGLAQAFAQNGFKAGELYAMQGAGWGRKLNAIKAMDDGTPDPSGPSGWTPTYGSGSPAAGTPNGSGTPPTGGQPTTTPAPTQGLPEGYAGSNAGTTNGDLTAFQRLGLSADPDQAYRYMMQKLGYNPSAPGLLGSFLKKRFQPLLEARLAASNVTDSASYMDEIGNTINSFGSGLLQKGGNFFGNLRDIGTQAGQQGQDWLDKLQSQDQAMQYQNQLASLRYAGSNPLVQQATADEMRRANEAYQDLSFYQEAGEGKNIDPFTKWLREQQRYRSIFGY